MNKISPNTCSVLILFFSFWFSIFPAYLYFYTLDASDINSVSSFENTDEEDSTPNLDRHEKEAAPPFLMIRMLMDLLLPAQAPNLFFQPQTSVANLLILRC